MRPTMVRQMARPGTTWVHRAGRSLAFRARRVRYDVLQEFAAASLAVHRKRRLRDTVDADRVTVVIANWNTEAYLRVALRALQMFTSPEVRVVVVDNASSDASSALLDSLHDVTVVRLERNIGHGLALDTGIQAAGTEYVLVLDVDAFPIDPNWVDAVIDPLRQGCTLAGGVSSGYVHPSYMAIRRSYFLSNRYSFAASYNRRLRLIARRRFGEWDAGQLISILDSGERHLLAPSEIHGPGMLGTVFGGMVYHHFYSTRLYARHQDDMIRVGLTPEISDRVWEESVQRFLG